MKSRLATLLRQAATTTFEELAFLFDEGVLHGPHPMAGAQPVHAAVAFTGPRSGCVELIVDAPLLPVLAANMLGAPDAPAPRLQHEALGEFCTVLCGHLLPAVAGSTRRFRVGPPKVWQGEDRVSPARVFPERVMVAGALQGRCWAVVLHTESLAGFVSAEPGRSLNP